MRLISLLMLLLSASQAVAAPIEYDNLIIPGERVGFITSNTTEQELRTLLAPNRQIKTIVHDAGEGNFECATEVFPNSERSAIVVWKNDRDDRYFSIVGKKEDFNEDGEFIGNRNKIAEEKCKGVKFDTTPEMVEIHSTFWQVKESNIRVNMLLPELEKAINKNIKFAACQCDYNGTLMDSPIQKLSLWFGWSKEMQTTLEKHSKPEKKDEASVVTSNDLPAKIKPAVSVDMMQVYF